MFLLSVESAPFVWVGLKCGSGHRRAGEDTRPYKNAETCPVNAVGAGHWPARILGGPVCRPYEIQGKFSVLP